MLLNLTLLCMFFVSNHFFVTSLFYPKKNGTMPEPCELTFVERDMFTIQELKQMERVLIDRLNEV